MADFSFYMRLPHLLAETLHDLIHERASASNVEELVCVDGRRIEVIVCAHVELEGICCHRKGTFTVCADSGRRASKRMNERPEYLADNI